jgi:hypothetical protein
MPVIPATCEATSGGSLEPRSSRCFSPHTHKSAVPKTKEMRPGGMVQVAEHLLTTGKNKKKKEGKSKK